LTHRGSVGRIQGEDQFKILNELGQECELGEVGEIYFKSAGGQGSTYYYLGAQPRACEGGWESIGDLGWMDEEGYVYLADRRTDLILRGGANIYPAEIEAALDAHPGVGSSVAIGLPDDEMGQRVHAIVQLKPEAAGRLNVADLQRFLADRIAKYKLPESYEFAQTYLRDDAGKVRRSSYAMNAPYGSAKECHFASRSLLSANRASASSSSQFRQALTGELLQRCSRYSTSRWAHT
jgi:bile acid-coenzyme A ligase